MAGNSDPLTYFQMWEIVQHYYNDGACSDAKFRGVVTQELLTAIFWEETQFANIRQRDFTHANWLVKPVKDMIDPNGFGNHAVGFGQVERETIRRCQSLYSRALGPILGRSADLDGMDLQILASKQLGVEVSWRVLWGYWGSGQFTTKEGLLQGYAGIKSRPPAEQEAFISNVHGWLKCEALLLAYQKMPPIQASNPWAANFLLMAGAFWLARSNGDFPRAFAGVSSASAAKVGKALLETAFLPNQQTRGYQTKPNHEAELKKFLSGFDVDAFRA